MMQTDWSTDNIHVFDSAGRKVAKLEQDSEHGDFIITAVNSHDRLLEALELVMTWIDNWDHIPFAEDSEWCEEDEPKIRAAIKAAR